MEVEESGLGLSQGEIQHAWSYGRSIRIPGYFLKGIFIVSLFTVESISLETTEK